MNEYLKLRYKTRVAFLLAIVLVCLLVNNIVGHESYDKLEQSATSIYADRLMPSTYIFGISELLFREQALVRSGMGDLASGQLQMHKDAINDLITKYELTSFTGEERKHWNIFKTNLASLHRTGSYGDAYQRHFEQTLRSLNALNTIQAKEGEHLNANVHTLVGRSSLRSHLETVLLIIIGGLAVQLIYSSKNVFEQKLPHSPSLN